MTILDKFVEIKDKLLSNSVLGFNGAQEDQLPDKLPVFPKWFFSARLGQPRGINVTQIRQFAQSSWVQMVLSTIKKEVSIIPWAIVKKDINDETDYTEQINKIKDFLENVNSDNWDIVDLIDPSITDIGEIDAAAWVKVYDRGSYETKTVPVLDDYGRQKGTEEKLVLKEFGKRNLIELRLADASTVLKQIDLYRRLQAYYQYSFKNPRSNPNRFEPDEMCYMWMNKKSYSIYGYSPVQSIQQVVEVLLQSTRWNKEFFKNNAIPDGIIGLEGANPDSMKKFKESWEKQTKGKAHKLLFHNTKANFASFAGSARDMEWLEGQKWYFHLVFGAFGVSPTEAGFYEVANRSTQEGQERITVKNAIKPYLKVFEKVISRNIIKEILQDDNPGIEFVFQPNDHASEEIEFNQSMQELDHNALTINEYRRMKGLDPVEWGDGPSQQQNPMDSEEDPKDEEDPKNQPSEPNPKKKEEKLYKSIEDPGEDVIDESKDYSDFLGKTIKSWESQVLTAIDKIDKSYSEKTFGEFLAQMMNTVNSLPFLGKIRKYIKQSMLEGITGAEAETGIQIGFGINSSERLKALEQQQLNGYTLPDGKQWYGIKGATKNMQFDILKTVQEGVKDKKSNKEIKEDIKSIFTKASDTQANRIARTETTRFINEGKLTAYKDSGLEGKKVWSAVMDSNTSDICRRLNGTLAAFDDPFIDKKTGVSYQYPPGHVNCRCVIEYSEK